VFYTKSTAVHKEGEYHVILHHVFTWYLQCDKPEAIHAFYITLCKTGIV